MRTWGRVVVLLGLIWLLTRWAGLGRLGLPDLRTAALWAAVLLAIFLVWRDGRPFLARHGFAAQDSPLAILERRLACGELDLRSYRRLRAELSDQAGIRAGNKNNSEPKRVLRGGP
ncbi:MAG: hypothetical protein ACM3X6_06195 [Patescibacteria group bacterium]